MPIEEAIHLLTDVPGAPVRPEGTRPAAGGLARRRRRHRSRDVGAQEVRMRFDLPDRRAAPVRRRRRHRPRARQRHRDRRPRRVHRRAPGHVAAVGPRHRDRHRVVAAPSTRWPRRGASSIGSGGAVAAVGPGRSASTSRPTSPSATRRASRDVDHRTPPPARHDDQAGRGGGDRRRLPHARPTTGRRTSSACSRATSGPIPSGRRSGRRELRRGDAARTSCGRARPPRRARPARGRLLRLFTGARRRREVPRRPPRRRAARRRPATRSSRDLDRELKAHISHACSTSACSRCGASRGTRRPRCSRS